MGFSVMTAGWRFGLTSVLTGTENLEHKEPSTDAQRTKWICAVAPVHVGMEFFLWQHSAESIEAEMRG